MVPEFNNIPNRMRSFEGHSYFKIKDSGCGEKLPLIGECLTRESNLLEEGKV